MTHPLFNPNKPVLVSGTPVHRPDPSIGSCCANCKFGCMEQYSNSFRYECREVAHPETDLMVHNNDYWCGKWEPEKQVVPWKPA